jgi:predicted nuclease of predicted toxin-antitoxin system
LADEDLRYEIVLAVRRREPSAEFATVREIGLAGAGDAEVLEHANANGLIVVSHDVNTLRADAERRLGDGLGLAGVLLTA